jgi:hypothetical protein
MLPALHQRRRTLPALYQHRRTLIALHKYRRTLPALLLPRYISIVTRSSAVRCLHRISIAARCRHCTNIATRYMYRIGIVARSIAIRCLLCTQHRRTLPAPVSASLHAARTASASPYATTSLRAACTMPVSPSC